MVSIGQSINISFRMTSQIIQKKKKKKKNNVECQKHNHPKKNNI